MFDMMKMLGKMKEVQSKMKETQDKLESLRIEGESGGGMVKVIVNGARQLISVDIDKDLVKPEDKDMIQDLVVAAVNIAMEKADALAKEEMQKSTQGMMPDIPGFDFGGMK